MVICMSCRRRCDPNRSFCTHCGSSVFIDSDERSAMHMIADNEPAATQATRAVPSARPPQRPRTQVAGTARSAPVAPSFPLGSLIRFAIFLFIVWKGGTFLLGIPEVRALVDAVQRGDTPAVQPALDSLGTGVSAAIQRAVLSATGTPAPPTPPQPRGDAAERERPSGDAARDTSAARIVPSAPVVGMTEPRAVRRVPPVYTQEAMRQRIQGTVLLRAIVDEDGMVSDVAVIRSLDKRFGLDQQAIAALKQWTFEPARRNGQPTRSFVQVELTFALQ